MTASSGCQILVIMVEVARGVGGAKRRIRWTALVAHSFSKTAPVFDHVKRIVSDQKSRSLEAVLSHRGGRKRASVFLPVITGSRLDYRVFLRLRASNCNDLQ